MSYTVNQAAKDTADVLRAASKTAGKRNFTAAVIVAGGSGTRMGTEVTKEDVTLATQANSKETPGMAYFSDMIRDAVRGSNSNASKTGYAAGAGGFASNVKDSFLGNPTWAKNPSQVVNYVSCHDGLSLFDRLTMSTQDRTLEEFEDNYALTPDGFLFYVEPFALNNKNANRYTIPVTVKNYARIIGN